jgi:TRAP-type mannitol/chloroaromatic compound transport system permease large subunit
VSPEWIGILSLVILFAAIFIGFPIAFTLIAIGLGVGYFALGKLALYLMTLQFFSVMRDPTLASVPFFLFMGYLLEQSGIMERLFRAIQRMLASVRGSLYLAVLITATIFAAATGIVGSSVTLLGVMAAPAMKRSGYDVRLSAGTIAAGGTLGILIPPSVMLIVMGPVSACRRRIFLRPRSFQACCCLASISRTRWCAATSIRRSAPRCRWRSGRKTSAS